ncbi:MAG: hypothetical protein ACRDSJ_08195, partial [Rubrobacteraceae bacterium]
SDPVYAAASSDGFGWATASPSYAAPDLASVAGRGILLAADSFVSGLDVSAEEVEGEVLRGLAEVGPSLPRLNAAGVWRMCESGARAAAEDGLIEEEDLAFFTSLPGDADALGRRAVSAGERGWTDGKIRISPYETGSIFDSESAESLGLERGLFAVVVGASCGELGRISLSLHRERIHSRVESGEFDSPLDLPAAPLETEEATDFLAAVRAAANFADARAALRVYALRRVLREFAGNAGIRASWRVGGVGEPEGLVVHRKNLAFARRGDVLVSGGVIAVGTGTMHESVPPFGVGETEGPGPWEESGLLERIARLSPLKEEG